MKFIRILWDIENVALPKESSVCSIVRQLQVYVMTQARVGRDEPFDMLVTAFMCPSKFHTTHAIANYIRLLDSACIEIIAVSEKREDADRKLVARAQRESRVLPPSDTVFAIVSSDKDFCPLYASLRSLGFRVIVVHCATTLEWEDSLSLYAHVCVQWNDIIKVVPADRLPSPLEFHRVVFEGKSRVHRSDVAGRLDPSAYGYRSVSAFLMDAVEHGYMCMEGAWLHFDARCLSAGTDDVEEDDYYS